jgi:hypothetical protein
LKDRIDPDGQYWAETNPAYKSSAQPEYKEIRLTGLIEGRFIYCTTIAKHVLPFAVLKPDPVVLPLLNENGTLSAYRPAQLKDLGYRHVAEWMDEVERTWSEKREAKAGRMSALEWLDYQGKLTAQKLNHRHLVLYNAAGTNVSAAHFDRESVTLPFVVDHKLYWAAFSDPREADYVTATLNSETVNDRIKPFQSTGLLGERDVHKKLLDLPIPIYNEAVREHRHLADLGDKAQKDAATVVKSTGFPAATSLARQRAFVRLSLKDTFAEINRLVKRIL